MNVKSIYKKKDPFDSEINEELMQLTLQAASLYRKAGIFVNEEDLYQFIKDEITHTELIEKGKATQKELDEWLPLPETDKDSEK